MKQRWQPRLMVAAILFVIACQPLFAEELVSLSEEASPILQQYCVRCHGGEATEGEVNFASPEALAALQASPDQLQAVVDAIDLAYMPPDEEPQPTSEERTILLDAFQKLLAQGVELAEHPRTPLRRMNRFQYANAVQDLLDLKVMVFSLPERILRDHGYFDPTTGRMPDKVRVGNRPLGKSQLIEPRLDGVVPYPQDLRAEHGFDNRGDHLTLSPLLMESFLRLGRSVVESRDFNAKNVGIWDEFYAPLDDESKQVDTVAGERLAPFLTRAFRCPVDDDTLQRYVDYVVRQHESGKSMPDCMREITAAVICSPRFLYLFDGMTAGTAPEELDDYELASRLSFFLWGSLPDAELLRVAEGGRLSEPDELAAQTDRMLKDPKIKRFCDSFPTQWMQLEQIVAAVPDPERYSQFYFGDFRLSIHMALEPLLVFETVLIEDRPIRQLLDSDFTYRSDLLDRWYSSTDKQDLKGANRAITSVPFRRIKLTDRRYGGVVTTAATMTMTSAPDRTKPITRGAWVATAIFNSPPPPPPADVPPLPEEEELSEEANGKKTKVGLSLRERLSQHQTRTDCASCHQKIDPYGFALENFGPVGEWRNKYRNGALVDSSGVLFDRHEFGSVIEFKDAMLKEHDRFAEGFASHLLSFALGREVAAADQPSIKQVVASVSESDYRLKALIKQVVASKPFMTKYNPAEQSKITQAATE